MGGEQVEDMVWCKLLLLREGTEVTRVDELGHLLSEVE